MSIVPRNYEKRNQNNFDISFYTSQNGEDQKKKIDNKCWDDVGKRNPHSLLIGLQTSLATREISVEDLPKAKNKSVL